MDDNENKKTKQNEVENKEKMRKREIERELVSLPRIAVKYR